MALVCAALSGAGFFTATAFAQAPEPVSLQQPVAEAGAAGNPWAEAKAGSLAGANLGFASVLVLAQANAVPPTMNFPEPGSIPGVVGTMSASVQAAIIKSAYQGLGHPYVWGGTSYQLGWDCSGFVQWAYRQAGLQLPRTEQWEGLTATSTPQPGDLVVQNPDGPNHWAHIGIYIGEGRMISALNPAVGTVLLPVAATEIAGKSMYFTMVDPNTDPKETDKATESPSASSSAPGTTGPGTGTPTTPPATSAPGSPSPSPSAPGSPSPSPTPTDPGTEPPVPSDPGTATPTPDPTPTEPPATGTGTPSPEPVETAAPSPEATALETATAQASGSPTAPASASPTALSTEASGADPSGATATGSASPTAVPASQEP
ncbi:NlpC/P60 family protein [Arthrobacter sp. 35W]|uniref:NlpC/P60 family protein n=1 Tax=Arthrobacter sp. 35W TaxID=1132441 RepID=UPI0006871E67